MSDYLPDRIHGTGIQPTASSDLNRRKQQSQQQRQLLSCTKCRERKVRCDRTKPCSACCARGQPKDCHFIAEGGDYAPIQQSYELRKVRAENLRLKERLRAAGLSIDDEDSDPAASPDSAMGDRPKSSQRRRAARQKRFQGSEWQDSIYFGSPGLASVVTDFAAVNITPLSASLAHIVPRGPDMYTPRNPPPHPFPTLFKPTPDECIPQLLACLPERSELLEYLIAFEDRVNVCSFPHVPIEITRSEVERFLDDAQRNAEMCPDMLALLFAAMALSGQHSVWDRSGGKWEAQAMPKELKRGNVYIAAAMQALRLASFMHRPSLLGIQALIMIGPYLTNSGRFLDAWSLFGTTIRLAHSIGLHRHPKYLDPAPPSQQECSIRQTLWWWMLNMDEQYSMTLGRPLGISGLGDCPPPLELTTDPHMLRFGEFVNRFIVLARQILSSDRLTNPKIDEFTDSLRGLLDTMPEMLQFDQSWLQEGREIPEWPLSAMAAIYYCKTHTYLILLNRQRVDRDGTASDLPNQTPQTSSFRPVNTTALPQGSPAISTNEILRGRALVVASSEDVLDAFLFFYMKVPAALISWTMGQQAFNSCMILLLDAMELKKITPGIVKVEKAYAVFHDLQDVHSLASLAVEKISWGLKELRDTALLSSDPLRSPEHYGNDMKMQDTGGGGTQKLLGIHEDTVMDATGMLLLEDPGLQSFVPEAFAPITWNSTGLDPPYPLAPKEEQEGFRGDSVQAARQWGSKSPEEDIHTTRTAKAMPSSRRSTVTSSGSVRYTASCVDNYQPPNAVAPMSQANLTRPSQQLNNLLPTIADCSRHDAQLPHFQHAPLDDARSNKAALKPAVSVSHQAFMHQPATSVPLHQFEATQVRYKHCPLNARQSGSAPPMLASAPVRSNAPNAHNSTAMAEYSSASREALNQPTNRYSLEARSHLMNPVVSSNVHPSWAARAVGHPPASTGGASVKIPTMTNIGQGASGFAHDGTQQQPLVYLQSAPSTPTPMANQIFMDDWRHWIES